MNSSDNSENQKALFVGNDSQTELILSEKLSKASIPFVKSQTLDEALREASSGNIDSIFLLNSDNLIEDISIYSSKASHAKIIPIIDRQNEKLGIDALRKGAFDYLIRPVNDASVGKIVSNLLYLQDLSSHLGDMKKKIKREKLYPDIVGESESIRVLLDRIDKVAERDVNVIIYGESGTGKELIARAIYENSRRKNHKFVSVNTGGITSELAESLLFGHKKGSFTGAISDHQGYFEQANQGILFLDEIGDMRLDVQVYLLRALETGKIRSVGDKDEKTIDVRVISATNKNLRSEIAERRFRNDLLYRLEEYPIELPALRERKDDIPLLANHFVKEFCRFYELDYIYIADSAMNQLVEYDWPGNIRELKNVIRREAVQAADSQIESFTLGSNVKKIETKHVEADIIPLAELEKRAIINAYNKLDKNPDKTAVMLGISRASIYRKLKQYGIV
ncbi:MAG TPA: sigma-54 dependent transcriptional regulator [Spirochaetota bacterium]|nr:sigma-54 dependent transcriptional regulator [Spirochaetota bacterium]HOR45622.1 sigma-54 dependent transcriptional regulator [Spirochaetota bacterium]HPK57072.1 sigma-54 dependent transcriptional regulator [Spirochaetota bacterium]HQE59180.1 sigma-54 dependent transcriptional regulator [Spirochaetota bacterium]